MGVRQRAQLLVESGAGTGAILLDCLQRAVDTRQRLFERLDEIRDRLVSAVEVDPRGLLELPQLGRREIEEGAIIAFEGVVRERGKGVAEARLARGGRLALGVELGAEP